MHLLPQNGMRFFFSCIFFTYLRVCLWCLFFLMAHLVRWWRALGCTTAGAAVGPDWGLCGVLSSWCCTEGAREGRGSLQVWGGCAHQQPHREDTMDKSLNNLCHYISCWFSENKSVVLSVFGAPTGRTAAGDTSAVTLWSNKVTAPETLELA